MRRGSHPASVLDSTRTELPYIVTVHDLLEHMYGSRNTRSTAQRALLSDAARVAQGSAGARGFAVHKNEIEKLLAIPDRRIEVVYNAIDERFLHGHATNADHALIASATR